MDTNIDWGQFHRLETATILEFFSSAAAAYLAAGGDAELVSIYLLLGDPGKICQGVAQDLSMLLCEFLILQGHK